MVVEAMSRAPLIVLFVGMVGCLILLTDSGRKLALGSQQWRLRRPQGKSVVFVVCCDRTTAVRLRRARFLGLLAGCG
jgi:hypothetical protein